MIKFYWINILKFIWLDYTFFWTIITARYQLTNGSNKSKLDPTRYSLRTMSKTLSGFFFLTIYISNFLFENRSYFLSCKITKFLYVSFSYVFLLIIARLLNLFVTKLILSRILFLFWNLLFRKTISSIVNKFCKWCMKFYLRSTQWKILGENITNEQKIY